MRISAAMHVSGTVKLRVVSWIEVQDDKVACNNFIKECVKEDPTRYHPSKTECFTFFIFGFHEAKA